LIFPRLRYRRAPFSLKDAITSPHATNFLLLTVQATQCAHFLPGHRMHRWNAVFTTGDVHHLVVELDLLPRQRN
jgi:hypothetical protein